MLWFKLVATDNDNRELLKALRRAAARVDGPPEIDIEGTPLGEAFRKYLEGGGTGDGGCD